MILIILSALNVTLNAIVSILYFVQGNMVRGSIYLFCVICWSICLILRISIEKDKKRDKKKL